MNRFKKKKTCLNPKDTTKLLSQNFFLYNKKAACLTEACMKALCTLRWHVPNLLQRVALFMTTVFTSMNIHDETTRLESGWNCKTD